MNILVPRAVLVTIRLVISHRSALWGAAADIMKFTQRAFDANVTLSSSDASDGAMIIQSVNAVLAELLNCSAVRSCHGSRELRIPLNLYLILDDIRLTTSKLMHTCFRTPNLSILYL